jgi:hypothetical protein
MDSPSIELELICSFVLWILSKGRQDLIVRFLDRILDVSPDAECDRNAVIDAFASIVTESPDLCKPGET